MYQLFFIILSSYIQIQNIDNLVSYSPSAKQTYKKSWADMKIKSRFPGAI